MGVNRGTVGLGKRKLECRTRRCDLCGFRAGSRYFSSSLTVIRAGSFGDGGSLEA